MTAGVKLSPSGPQMEKYALNNELIRVKSAIGGAKV
jgi:hypothetical protein